MYEIRGKPAEAPHSRLPPITKIGLVLLVVSIILSGIVIAYLRATSVSDDHEGRVSIPPGEFFSFDFVVVGDFTEIYYEFTVATAGAWADIYLINETNFDRYLSGLPLLPLSLSHEGIREISGSPYPPEGRYVAVIDNTDYGLASPSGRAIVVSYVLMAGGAPGGTGFFVGTCGFLSLGIFLGAVLVVKGYLASSDSLPPCPRCGYRTDAAVCGRCATPIWGPRLRP